MTDEQRTAIEAAIEEGVKAPGLEWSAPSPLGALALALGLPAALLARWDAHEALGGGAGSGPTVAELRGASRLPAPLAAYPEGVLEAVDDAWRAAGTTEAGRDALRTLVAGL